jgi:hypothetical protein
MRRLSYLLLATITLFKLQVFGTVLRITRKYHQYSMIVWIYQILMSDPEVIIKIDVSNAFNSTDRPFTLDCIVDVRRATMPVALSEAMLLALLAILKTYVHLTKGGQQGDPLEILIFNLTIQHLWGRVLTKFREARAITNADDGYIKRSTTSAG